MKPTPAAAPSSLARVANTAAEEALARVGALETLEEAFDAWLELKTRHAAFATRCAAERKKWGEQGAFLVGAVRAAASAGPSTRPDALAPVDGSQAGLAQFLEDAEAKLKATRDELERDMAQAEAHYTSALEALRKTVRDRVARYAANVRPRLKLTVRPAGPGHHILHLEKVGRDESVVLLYLLTGRVPSRYGFLFDDTTEDMAQGPALFYPDEGVTPEQTRPDALRTRALIEERREVLPVKGFVPVFVGGFQEPELFRLLQRGPVLEVELAEGAAFRNLLTPEEGQRFAGHLVRTKLSGGIELEIEAE